MLNLNWKKIHSIILFVTCHGWRNFPLLIHIPLYPFVNFQNPMSYYFLSLSFDPPHPTPTWPTPPPSWPTPTHPTPPLHGPPHPTPPHPWYIFGHKGAFFHGLLHYVSLLWVIIFWVRVTHKMLNVNWEKIHSIILSVTHHGLRNFAPTHTHPLKPIQWIFETLPVIIFWIRVTCKMLNVTCIKIHSIILSLTCHGLRNFPLLMHIPSNPFVNFW